MTKFGKTISKNLDQHFEILKKISTKSFTNKIFLASKIISDSLQSSLEDLKKVEDL